MILTSIDFFIVLVFFLCVCVCVCVPVYLLYPHNWNYTQNLLMRQKQSLNCMHHQKMIGLLSPNTVKSPPSPSLLSKNDQRI